LLYGNYGSKEFKMTYTSPTAINGSQGIMEILEYVNEVTSSWISRMLLVAIFIIFLMGYLRSKTDEDFLGAFAIGSYATLVVSIPLWLIGFVDGVSFSLVIGVSIISATLLLIEKRGQ